MDCGVIVVGATLALTTALELHLKHWPKAHMVSAQSELEVDAFARQHQWSGLLVVDFADQVDEKTLAQHIALPPYAFHFCRLDPSDTQQAVLILGVEIAKLTRSSNAWRAPVQQSPVAGSMSRRALFSKAVRQLPPTPSVRPFVGESCRLSQGCTKCVDACPFGAIVSKGTKLEIDDRCQVCGTCVAVCPNASMLSSHFSDDQWSGILQAMKLSTIARKRLILTCDKARSLDREHGTVVQVLPCIGILGVAHLTQAAAFGPQQVTAWCPCPQECSKTPSMHRLQRDVAVVQSNIAQSWVQLSVVQGSRGPEPLEMGTTQYPNEHRGIHGDVKLEGNRRENFIDALALVSKETITPSVDGQLYSLEVSASCTFCGACQLACKDGALQLKQEPQAVQLRVDQGRCIGCGACANKCAEKAIGVVDASEIKDLLAKRKTQLASSSLVRCRSCNTVIGSKSLMERLGALLASDKAAMDALDYCPTCKITQMTIGKPF